MDHGDKKHTPFIVGGIYRRANGTIGEEVALLFSCERVGERIEGLLHSKIYGLSRVVYRDSLDAWEYVSGGADVFGHLKAPQREA